MYTHRRSTSLIIVKTPVLLLFRNGLYIIANTIYNQWMDTYNDNFYLTIFRFSSELVSIINKFIMLIADLI